MIVTGRPVPTSVGIFFFICFAFLAAALILHGAREAHSPILFVCIFVVCCIAAWDKFFASHRHDVRRLALGRSRDGSVGLELRDQNDRVRLAVTVRSTENLFSSFFNEDGKVLRELTSASK